MIKRIFACVSAAVSLVACAGCWDIKEINQLALVDMLASDLDDEGVYHVYFQVLNPPSIEARRSGPTKAAAYTYRVSGPTMGRVTEATGSILSRRIYTSHLQCYILSERQAKKGLLKFLNLMENYPELRTNVYTMIAEQPLSKIMNTFTVLDRIPGRNIRLLMDMHAKSFGINKLPIRMKDLIVGIPFSRPTILPLVQYIGNGSSANSDRLEDIDATKNILKFTGGAVFVKGRMAGKIDTETKNVYYVLNGYAHRLIETFKVNGESVVTEVMNIQVKRNWTREGSLKLRIRAKLGIINNEQNQRLTIRNLEEIERAFDAYYKEKCESFVRFSLDKEWDLLGIGDTGRGRDKWETIPVLFDVRSKVTSLGNTITPLD